MLLCWVCADLNFVKYLLFPATKVAGCTNEKMGSCASLGSSSVIRTGRFDAKANCIGVNPGCHRWAERSDSEADVPSAPNTLACWGAGRGSA